MVFSDRGDGFGAVVGDFDKGVLDAATAWDAFQRATPEMRAGGDGVRLCTLLLQRHGFRPLGLDPVELTDIGLALAFEDLEDLRHGRQSSAREASIRSNASILHFERWYHHQDADGADLWWATRHIEAAISQAMANDPLPAWHVTAAAIYSDLAFARKDPDIFGQAIDHADAALSEAERHESFDQEVAARFNRSEALAARFRLTGNLDDLDDAIDEAGRLAAVARRTPWEDKILSHYASVLAERHRVGGEPEDLDLAIDAGFAALESSTDPDPLRRNLAMRLSRRHDLVGDPRDLFLAEDLALQSARGAAGAMAVGRIAVWVARVRDVARWTGRFDHVRDALREGQRALEDADPDAPERPMLAYYLSLLVDETLRTRHMDARFGRHQKLRWIDVAIAGLSDRDPQRTDYLSWRAVATLTDRGEPNVDALADAGAVDNAVRDMQDAVQSLHANLSTFARAQDVLDVLAASTDQQSKRARRKLAEVLPKAIDRWLGGAIASDRADQAVRSLTRMGSLAVDSILDFLESGEPVERQRAIAGAASNSLSGFWIERLDSADVVRIEAQHPMLAERWKQHLLEVRLRQSGPRSDSTSSDTDVPAPGTPYSAATERRHLLAEIRSVVPEFGHQADNHEALLALSRARPVLVLVSSATGLRAIAMSDGQSDSIHVPVPWEAVLSSLRHAMNTVARLGGTVPYRDAFGGVMALLAPVGRELAALLRGVDGGIAVLGDGLSRSLPWSAVPTEPGQHLIDDHLLVLEPAIHLAAPHPTVVPAEVSIIDGGRSAPLGTRHERRWLVDHRASQVIDIESLDALVAEGRPFPASGFLHVLAHGTPDAAAPRRSGIVVDSEDGTRVLRADELARAGYVPEAVFLAACSMANSATTWESSTLASSVADTFRSFGTASVVGYLTTCDDQAAAALSIRLHQVLGTTPGGNLADATRQVQLWARNGTDDELTRWCHEHLRETAPTLPSLLRRPAIWGNLVVSGW